MNIYVGNLSFKVDENDLAELFEDYGKVSSSKIITDKFSGKSRGFGFVTMENQAEAGALARSRRSGIPAISLIEFLKA